LFDTISTREIPRKAKCDFFGLRNIGSEVSSKPSLY
jgi:hypothetical protein